MVGALSDSWVLVQEYGGILEIIDVAAAKSIRRFSGVNPVVSSDRKLLAWETRVVLEGSATHSCLECESE